MTDKIGSPAQQLVRRVGEVATKVATKLSPIIEVTVISRNPDGSLNVSDGRGGCLRMAPKANVRIGEKIRLGTEPAIGTQTNLIQVSIQIDPSTKPCPADDRDCIPTPGVDCPPPFVLPLIGLKGYTSQKSTFNSWSDRNDLSGVGIGYTASMSVMTKSQWAPNPDYPFVGVVPRYSSFRSYLSFSAPAIQSGWEVLDFSLSFTNDSGLRSNSMGSGDFCICKSTIVPPVTSANWLDFTTDPIATKSFGDIVALAGGPFTMALPIDAASFGAPTTLVATTSWDLTGDVPPDSETISPGAHIENLFNPRTVTLNLTFKPQS